jgi:hypothetical protein
MKHSVDQILGHDPWEIEIAYYVKKTGIDPETARVFTIVRWMELGDLRPLYAAIVKAPALDDKLVAIDGAILSYLKELIEQGRLVVKPRGRHRPKSPDKFARDLVGALSYERAERAKGKSEAVFQEVAASVGMTKDALKEAVASFRKRLKPTWNNSPT